ncbi:hypothetical protein [uncultured Desulfobacter sp.]|uniref:hypothetical protein n=1 Tax=uncultured Desulfobacter sp. TaxID=240139 RepID=UPI0029F4CEBC|nr:hypothetical protein [uncultured Desulfobacter sp.]
MLREIETLLNKEVFLTASLSKQSRELYTQLISNLGKGEASCIALAKFTKGTVVTDDRAARQTCVDLELSYTGTLGILKACVPDGTILVEKADGLLEQMISQGFYSPVRRISDILP